MVEKQRKLILGFDQDLKKAAKDRERYRRQIQEYKNMFRSGTGTAEDDSSSTFRKHNESPALSDSSADLPIQRQSSEKSSSSPTTQEVQTTKPPPNPNPNGSKAADEPATAPLADSIVAMNSDSKIRGSQHSHKHTSSSDVGVFNLTKATQEVPSIQTSNLGNPSISDGSPGSQQTSSPLMAGISPTSSFTAKRSKPYSTKPFNGPALTLTESTPTGNDLDRMTPPRKAPPAPLDLGQPKQEPPLSSFSKVQSDRSASEYEDDVEVDELPAFERGRKKTREDDDRERELLQQKEEEERSRSKKDKKSKSRSHSEKKLRANDAIVEPQMMKMPQSIKPFAPKAMHASTPSSSSQPGSLAGMLDPLAPRESSNVREQTIVARTPLSPGLPVSPRPSDRPMNAPTPRLPRDAKNSVASPSLSPMSSVIGLPLSPRGPKQPIPLPPHTPLSLPSSSPAQVVTEPSSDSTQTTRDLSDAAEARSNFSEDIVVDSDSVGVSSHMSTENGSKGIFKGFVSEEYPGLLIPPNALPSIKITVVSSRLKPSRYSMVLKGTEEEPVFTLGVSARFDRRELWQVEKPILSLHFLDQQLKQSPRFDVKLPDRSLFIGHAPARVDARRKALEKYFETILDTQMDDKAAVNLCQYLSTNVSEPGSSDIKGNIHPASPTVLTSNGQITKEGYLTKRGKSFGGWKSRFFVLDDPTLRYYETPGGALLGTIKLVRAQIGRPSQQKLTGSGDEGDGQYRHAFLIKEPKRKDPNSFTDHVLCAESDSERDAWVDALLRYISPQNSNNSPRPALEMKQSSSTKMPSSGKNSTSKMNGTNKESPDSEDFSSLQAVPYQETRPAQPPHVRITPDPRPDESPSPTSPGLQPSDKAPSVVSKQISGPQNGTKINDAGAWGNKPMASPFPVQKEHKKRSLFGFHNKDTSHLGTQQPNSSDLSLSQQQYQERITNVKAAFGAPLADAVQFCPPKGASDVYLPAVVYRCIRYLEAKNAVQEEGIFRMSGSTTLIKNLKNKFNAEGDFDLLTAGQHYDIHAVASLLKQYLRDLPAMILTKDLHMRFLAVLGIHFPKLPHSCSQLTNCGTELHDDSKKPPAFNVLVHQLPKPNFHLLRALSAFLVTVVKNCEVNKMDNRNVGIVFSPTLNIPTPVILMFLTDFDIVFGSVLDESNARAIEPPTSQVITADDIRSPRRQLFSDLPTPAYNETSFRNNQQVSRQEIRPDDISTQQDLGFTPLQTAYEVPKLNSHPRTQESTSVTVPGPEYAVARPRNLAPGASTKQSRRESSMLLMTASQRKNSLPMMRADQSERTSYA